MMKTLLTILLTVIISIPTCYTYEDIYIDPPLNTNYPLRELGRYTYDLSEYIASLDIDHDGMDEIAFLSTETLYRLYILGEKGLEYSLDTQSIVNGIYPTYLAEDNDTLYLLFITGSPGLLIPKIVKVYYGNGSYTYDLNMASPLAGVGPYGPAPMNPLRAIVIGHRYLVSVIKVSTGMFKTRYALLIIDLITLNSSLYPWSGSVSTFFTPSYFAINNYYYIYSSKEIIVIGTSNRTINLPVNYSSAEIVSIVPLRISYNELIISYIYGENIIYQNNSFKYTFKIDLLSFNSGNSSIRLVDTRELVSYTGNLYSNFTPYTFIGAVGYGGNVYIVFNRNNSTVLFTYNTIKYQLRRMDLPLKFSYIIPIIMDSTLYIYMFGSMDGYYIFDPLNSLFKYVRLNVSASLFNSEDVRVWSAVLTDINGDQLYELAPTYLSMNISRGETLYVLYISSISPPEDLLPLTEAPFLAYLTPLIVLVYII